MSPVPTEFDIRFRNSSVSEQEPETEHWLGKDIKDSV